MKPIGCGSLELAQARLQARHGQRLDEAAWGRIESPRGFAQALAAARRTVLQPWLGDITADTPPAQVESTLRAQFRALVAEAQGWMPAEWQHAVAWCATLPDLAPLQHLARGGAAPAWMRDDAAWRTLCEAEPRDAGLAQTAWAPLASAWRTPDRLGAAWVAEWQARCPARPASDGDVMARLAAGLQAHAATFAEAPSGQGPLQRAALRARLCLLLRSATLQPAALFIHLALCALDLERLRGELLRRAWFPQWKVA